VNSTDILNNNRFAGMGRWLLIFAILIGAVTIPVIAQQDNTPTDPPETVKTTEPANNTPTPEVPTVTAQQKKQPEAAPSFLEVKPNPSQTKAGGSVRDPKSYGLWTLAPALVAILLAILLRQVIPALVIGILVGAYMLVPCLPATDAFANSHYVIAGLRLAAETYIIGVITDADSGFGKIKIMVFTLMIGFTVGVIGRNGGTAGMVRLVTGQTESTRRGALTAWLGGLVVFFDDYANVMIIGPTMRSVFDRLKISRAKLAYIIDSTAAPVASLALVGTWVGTEISYINSGLNQLKSTNPPEFLLDVNGQMMSGMTAFIYSLPFRFYPILALFLVFLVCLTGRDFGPMRKSQDKAGKKVMTGGLIRSSQSNEDSSVMPNWWLGVIPIMVLVVVTLGVLVQTGMVSTAGIAVMQQENTALWFKISTIFGEADSYISIYYGALMSAVVALILTAISRAVKLKDAVDAGLEGMSRMFPAIVILILAWSLSAVEQNLKLSEIVGDQLLAAQFPAHWLPLAVFICSAGISFATGSSWATMGILCPIAVTLSVGLVADLDPANARSIFLASVGSVLAGAIFGDHCSPISDTTVLSSIAAECPHEEHVWTQLPYALVAAVAAMAFGDVMCSVYKQPWYYGLGAGAFLLLFVVIVFARSPKPSYEMIASTS